MIWAILFFPIFILFATMFKILGFIPLPFPQGVDTAFQTANSYIWKFNGVFPIDILFTIGLLALGIEGFFLVMFIFGWHAKKIPGIN